jgi:two-component system, NarL family, sensor kinase
MRKARINGGFFIVLLFLICSGTFGQPRFNQDSLRSVIDSGATGAERDKALKCLAEGYMKSDPDLSLTYADMLMESSKASGNKAAMTDAFWLKGRAQLAKGSYDSTVLYCDSGISVAASAGLPGIQAELNTTKGTGLYYSHGPDSGIIAYRESYRLFADAMDSSGMAKALNGLGVMYKKMAQYDSAVSCYIKLITIAERKGYENTLGMGYLNLGILLQDLKEFDKAYHYLNLSIPINEKYREDFVALAHMNIGLLDNQKGDMDSALIEYRVALSIYASLNERKSTADVYNNIGNLFYKWQKLDSAYKYFNLARDLYHSLEYWYAYAQVYNNLALIYMDWGKYHHALEFLDTSMYYANETGNTELLSTIYRNLYSVFNDMGDYRKALDNYLVYDSLDKIMYTLAKEKLMADLEMKYENEKKQGQILALEKANLEKDLDLQVRTKQRNAFLFIGIGIILLISFAFLYFRQRTVKDRIIAQQRIRQLEEEKKLLAARSLVEGQEEERKRIARELHDGLGVLLSTTRMQFSAIRDRSPENQPLIERASKLLEQASNDVRKISHNMMPGLLTKLGLFEAVIDLFEKVSETQGLIVRVNIPEDAERLPENKEIMLYRIIQELVNNTLKHAKAKTLDIRMEVLPENLEIFYSDDGKGFKLEEKAGSKSLGLQSIESRVNFLNGKMQFYSEPGKGVSYKIEIPK